jgi:hypothetical protein
MRSAYPSKSTVLHVDGPVAGTVIACDSGAAWITQRCDAMDYVLTAGDDFTARREGEIVVQIVRAGKISIRLRRPSAGEDPAGSQAGYWRALQALVGRWGRRLSRGLLTEGRNRHGRFGWRVSHAGSE